MLQTLCLFIFCSSAYVFLTAFSSAELNKPEIETVLELEEEYIKTLGRRILYFSQAWKHLEALLEL